MRVLIIEDEQAIRENLVDLLKSESIEVLEVSNGMEAFNVLKQEKFDLVITDYHMPKMTGLDLIRLCREEGISVPVICLTGKDSIELRRFAWELGFYDYIEKSANTEEVVESVTSFIKMNPERLKVLIETQSSPVVRIPFALIAPKIHKTTYRGFFEWCDLENKSLNEMASSLLSNH